MNYVIRKSNKRTTFATSTRDKIKYGMFQPKWSKYSNSIAYIYYTMKGYRGTGGFTLNRAYYLLKTGALKLK